MVSLTLRSLTSKCIASFDDSNSNPPERIGWVRLAASNNSRGREISQTIGQGAVVVRLAPRELRERIDPWGPIGDGLPVMQAAKQRFDLTRTLNAGRGPGGL